MFVYKSMTQSQYISSFLFRNYVRLYYLYSLDFEYEIVLYLFVMQRTLRGLLQRSHTHTDIIQSQLMFSKASQNWLTIEWNFAIGQTSGGLDADLARQSTRMLRIDGIPSFQFYCQTLRALSTELHWTFGGYRLRSEYRAHENRYLAQIFILAIRRRPKVTCTQKSSRSCHCKNIVKAD